MLSFRPSFRPGFRLALAQLSPAMGELSANSTRILHARANAPEADLLVTPALALIGAPPQDLAQKPALQLAADHCLQQLAAATRHNGPALLVGTLVNGAPGFALVDKGQLTLLPPDTSQPVTVRGHTLGFLASPAIDHPDAARRLADKLAGQGAQFLVLADASPFAAGVGKERRAQARALAQASGLGVAYINRTGGQDGWVFDGGSFAINADGTVQARLAGWDDTTTTIKWNRNRGFSSPLAPPENAPEGVPEGVPEGAPEDPMEALYHAMITGLRDYVRANRFPGVVLGLSGGIDSALTAAIAVDALGPEKVWCVLLPSRYTTAQSLDDAAGCARLLGTRFDTIPITPAIAALDDMLAPIFANRAADLAEENIQARLRMVALMGISNKFGHMLLTTGNKSELAVGYSTIYGDLAGGYSVLKDAYKSEVFALSRWRNAHKPRLALGPDGPVMPDNVITKPPSAELRDDQRDDDSLPPYDILDPILRGLIEENLSVTDLAARGFAAETVARIERLIHIGEYKRQQAPPGVRLSRHDFTYGRHYPITNGFRTA